MEKTYLEDYALGERFVSPARTITEADLVNFAGITGDWHPLHTDEAFAAASAFGGRIAHGMLVLSIGSALLFRLGQYVTLPQTFIGFYGMDSLRFTAPVRIGDTIRCEMEVIGLDVKDEQRGILVGKNVISNQRNEGVALFTTRALVGRRPQTS